MVKYSEATRDFILLSRRWVVERSFAWATRFRRLVKDYKRLPCHYRAVLMPRNKRFRYTVVGSCVGLKVWAPSIRRG